MNLFSAMVAIAAIVGVVAISRYWFESRNHAAADHERVDRIEEEFRERIEALEEIVIDQREKLRKQIDEL